MKIVAIIFSAFLLSGCSMLSNSKQDTTNTPPAWLHDANYIQGKISAVGSAGIHIKGQAAQEKLAIQRAVEQIAMQLRTRVSTATYREDSNGKATKAQTQSLQETDKVSVSTKVVDKYRDRSGKIYVLVVQE